MSSRKAFRLAPARNGARVAEVWRFWHQGNEFYAASTNRISGVTDKISFHGSGNWQMNIGHSVIKFTPTKRVAEKWLHAMSLRWFLLPGAFEPYTGSSERVTLIDVSEEEKLVVSLLVSTGTSEIAPPHPLGNVLWRQRLRGGRWVAIQALSIGMADSDKQLGLRVRQMIAINVNVRTLPSGFSAEAHEIYSDASQGNILAIVPLGPESIVYPKPSGNTI